MPVGTLSIGKGVTSRSMRLVLPCIMELCVLRRQTIHMARRRLEGKLRVFLSYVVSLTVTDWAEFSAVIRHLCTGQVRSAKEYMAPQAGYLHTSMPLGYVQMRMSRLLPLSLNLGQRVMPIQPHVSKTRLHTSLLGMKIESTRATWSGT